MEKTGRRDATTGPAACWRPGPTAFRTFPAVCRHLLLREWFATLAVDAFSPSTYSLPRFAIDPAMYALLPARMQSSRATSGVSFVLTGRVISFSVAATLLSEAHPGRRLSQSTISRIRRAHPAPRQEYKTPTHVSLSVSGLLARAVVQSRAYECRNQQGGYPSEQRPALLLPDGDATGLGHTGYGHSKRGRTLASVCSSHFQLQPVLFAASAAASPVSSMLITQVPVLLQRTQNHQLHSGGNLRIEL